MKILVITRYFPPIIGGISNSLKAFNDTFKKYNHTVSIFIFNRDINPDIKFPKNVYKITDYKKYIKINVFLILKDFFYFFSKIFNLHYSFKKKISSSFNFIKGFKKLAETINICQIISYYDELYNFDVILSYDSTIPAQIGFLLKKKIKKKFIVISHGNDILNKNLNAITLLALKYADKIIVRSNFIKNLVSDIYNIKQNKIHICTDGIILEDQQIYENKFSLREELNLSKNDFCILSVGLLNLVRKGYDLVLKSIKELRDKHRINIDFIEYILVGRDNQKVRKWLINLAETYNVRKNFKILVDISDELRNKYYYASDIFVMPSRDLRNKGSIEGFGNTFIESGYYYLPSIGTNTGGIPDTIENGKSGFVVNNFDELVEKIKLLFFDKECRLKMGKYAHERVIKKFTWEIIYLDYMKAFNFE